MRENEGEHCARAHITERGCASLERGAGGAHVVDEEDARAIHARWIARGEDTGDVHDPPLAIERRLAGRIAMSFERSRREVDSERARDRCGEESGLVVAPIGEPAWMKGDRNDEIDGAAEALRDTEHRSSEERSQIGAVFVLEPCDGGRHRSAVLERRRPSARVNVAFGRVLDRRGARRTEEDAGGDR